MSLFNTILLINEVCSWFLSFVGMSGPIFLFKTAVSFLPDSYYPFVQWLNVAIAIQEVISS